MSPERTWHTASSSAQRTRRSWTGFQLWKLLLQRLQASTTGSSSLPLGTQRAREDPRWDILPLSLCSLLQQQRSQDCPQQGKANACACIVVCAERGVMSIKEVYVALQYAALHTCTHAVHLLQHMSLHAMACAQGVFPFGSRLQLIQHNPASSGISFVSTCVDACSVSLGLCIACMQRTVRQQSGSTESAA